MRINQVGWRRCWTLDDSISTTMLNTFQRNTSEGTCRQRNQEVNHHNTRRRDSRGEDIGEGIWHDRDTWNQGRHLLMSGVRRAKHSLYICRGWVQWRVKFASLLRARLFHILERPYFTGIFNCRRQHAGRRPYGTGRNDNRQCVLCKQPWYRYDNPCICAFRAGKQLHFGEFIFRRRNYCDKHAECFGAFDVSNRFSVTGVFNHRQRHIGRRG